MTPLTVPLAPLLVTEELCDDPDRCVAPGLAHPMLSVWATVDALPEVECETCDGAGFTRHPSPEHPYHEFCPDCHVGRRPLRSGDRVRLVQGEWPTVADHRAALSRFPDMPALPMPGTVVGEAVVDWVGPIEPGDDGWPTRGSVQVTNGEPWHVATRDEFGWSGTRITGHDHLDWSPGRFAIRLREAKAA